MLLLGDTHGIVIAGDSTPKDSSTPKKTSLTRPVSPVQYLHYAFRSGEAYLRYNNYHQRGTRFDSRWRLQPGGKLLDRTSSTVIPPSLLLYHQD